MPETRARMRRRFPGRARGDAAARRAAGARRHRGAARRSAERPRRRGARHGRRAAVPPPRLRGRARASRRARRCRTATSRRSSARPGSARAVGQALGRNPFAIVVPCHRVLAAGGKIGGFSANGGVATKLRLLAHRRRAGDAPARAVRRRRRVRLRPGRGRRAPARSRSGAGARHRRRRPVRACSSRRTPSLFGALAEAIVYQQLNGKAAATIFARVCALFPRAHEGPTRRADPARLRREAPRRRPLARQAAVAARPRATQPSTARFRRSPRPRAWTTTRSSSASPQVRGIGRWTVEMLLIFRLGRPDVLPADDYGIRKGFAVAFASASCRRAEAIERAASAGSPYRTVASWYLWRAPVALASAGRNSLPVAAK